MTDFFFALLLSRIENEEEQQILADLYLNYCTAVAKYISKHLKADPGDIEDCVQQCYLNVARNMETVAALEPRRRLAYLLTAALTTARKFLLKRKDVVFADVDSEELDNLTYSTRHRAAPSAEFITMEREALQAFYDRLSELSPTEQTVFDLYILGQMDRDALAKQLGISSDSVRTYISRTTRHARQILREVCSLD